MLDNEQLTKEKLEALAFDQRKALKNQEYEYDQQFISPVLELSHSLGLIETPQMERLRDEYRFDLEKSDEKIKRLTEAYLDLADQMADADSKDKARLASAIFSIAFYFPLSFVEVPPEFEGKIEEIIEVAKNMGQYKIATILEQMFFSS